MLTTTFIKDRLSVRVYDTRTDMGKNAAADAAAMIHKVILEKGEANVIFAAAPSQNDFIEALIQMEGIDWSKVNAYHMDEYIGIAVDAIVVLFERINTEKISEGILKINLETGEISKALGRGKHTTRHVELIELFKKSEYQVR